MKNININILKLSSMMLIMISSIICNGENEKILGNLTI